MDNTKEIFVRMSDIEPFLKSLAKDGTCPLHIAAEIDQILETAPRVDAVEVKHGRWTRKPIGKYTGVDEVCCSICGYFIGVVTSDTGFREAIEGMNYCSNCGAKMD